MRREVRQLSRRHSGPNPGGCLDCEQGLQSLHPVSVTRRFIPADAMNPGETHRYARFVTEGSLNAFKSDLKNEVVRLLLSQSGPARNVRSCDGGHTCRG